jgi:hypothetical protein
MGILDKLHTLVQLADLISTIFELHGGDDSVYLLLNSSSKTV